MSSATTPTISVTDQQSKVEPTTGNNKEKGEEPRQVVQPARDVEKGGSLEEYEIVKWDDGEAAKYVLLFQSEKRGLTSTVRRISQKFVNGRSYWSCVWVHSARMFLHLLCRHYVVAEALPQNDVLVCSGTFLNHHHSMEGVTEQ